MHNRGVSPERVRELKRMHDAGTLLAHLRERHGLPDGDGDGPMPPGTLKYAFPTSHAPTRTLYARILQVLDAYGEIEEANAVGVLRRRLERHGVDTGAPSTLSTRVKDLTDEGLVIREVEGKRTRRLALTEHGASLDLQLEGPLPPKVSKVNGQVPTDPHGKRLADLAAHVEAAHPELWASLDGGTRTDLRALERLDAPLHLGAPTVAQRAAQPEPLNVELEAIRKVTGAVRGLTPATVDRVLEFVRARAHDGAR